MSSDTTRAHRGTAVVTGAARGLGREFACALAQAGHDIAILDHDDAASAAAEACERALAVGINVRTVVQSGDASDPAAVSHFAQRVREELSPVRVVVNNAGISPYAPIDATTLDLWHTVLRVNLDSLYLVTTQFLPDLRAHGRGRIVNITSSVVWDAQARDMTAYATSKAGIVGFTRAMAGELGGDGITVNAIAPGIVLTPDIRGRVAHERLETYRTRQSVQVLAEAPDLVPALLFLVDEASAQVTGTIVPVNGGRVNL